MVTETAPAHGRGRAYQKRLITKAEFKLLKKEKLQAIPSYLFQSSI